MGLLDEAIREHLELKRRSGADPGEVAREEREALEPVFPHEDEGADDGAIETLSEEGGAEIVADAHAAGGELTDAASTLGMETAELDMVAVMEADTTGAEIPAVENPPPDQAAMDTWLEPDPADEHAAGQERLSFE